MMLQVNALCKSYRQHAVLRRVSFSIGKNEIVGLIGPNGSGKTTLLNILMGIVLPTSGSFGFAPSVTLGTSVSRMGFIGDMSVRDNLITFAELGGLSSTAVDAVLHDFNIDFARMRFAQLSAGMKQRVSLAFAFLFNSNLILLDEPSNHLDIDSLIHLRNRITTQRQHGTSLLITSHILSDLEQVCDRILFLQRGTLVADRRKDDLVHEFGSLEAAYLQIKTS